jgi:FlaA1/EpsC-like NDP-sugar epimerase
LARLGKRNLVDAIVLAASLWTAYLFRFEFAIPADTVASAVLVTPFVVGLQAFALRHFGVHKVVGRYLSYDDLGAFARAANMWLVPMLAVRVFLPDGPWRIPVSITFMDTLLAIVGLLAIRLAQRMQAEFWSVPSSQPKDTKEVLLVGAGEAGVQVAREIRRHQTGLHAAGFVDDDPKKHGAVIAACEVLGETTDIPRLVEEHNVDHVIITILDAPADVVKRIAAICATVPIRVRTVPGLLEIVQGSVAITRFRDVEIGDLLGRDPVNLDPAELQSYLQGRVAMVTGSGGSIGSELARQVAEYAPSRLLLVERFEGALFEIHRELAEKHPDVLTTPLVADITDRSRMKHIFRDYGPDVVIHAAAHKHVAMMELNAAEAVKNNTLGTHVVAELAGEFRTTSFVLVSTDKAVRPSSVMGASKRLAEIVVRHHDQRFPDTRFIAVRFGNVMDSSGSVVRIFKDQVLKGGPLTVTHEDASRYFMTIPEAARLVLTAGAIGEGGEVMVLDMGQPVRIIDLAHNLIRLSGYTDGDIPIEITGLKPGEKIEEELYAESEEMELTRHPKIFIGHTNDSVDIDAVMTSLRDIAATGDGSGIRRVMHDALSESQLIESDIEARPPGP